jgi:ATP-binding protein involved in chromosome partitioning
LESFLSAYKEKMINFLTSSDMSTKLGDELLTPSMISFLEIVEGVVKLTVTYGYPLSSKFSFLKEQIINGLMLFEFVNNVEVEIDISIVAHSVQRGNHLLPGVKNIIAIASGKGGVGKSTTTINIALALKSEGAKVGVLDADIYGPSIPLMLGIEGKPESPDGQKILPMHGHGLQANSIGFLVPKDEAMVWRGPMVTQALEQLLRQTLWDNLDYLLIDLPPGTGDIHLTLAQKVPLTGAVIVTTPQEISVLDARKGLKMFQKVSVPILGVIENMSTYICPNCNNSEQIFGQGGGETLCEENQVNFLGSLPLNKNIRESSDNGNPIMISQPESKSASLYRNVAKKISKEIADMGNDLTSKFPKITIEKT